MQLSDKSPVFKHTIMLY